MSTLVISSRQVLLADGRFHEARLELANGRIRSISPLSRGERPTCDFALVPGLIDLQVNGIDDVDVWATALDEDHSAWQRINDYLLDQGVTSWCPTLVTAPLDRYRAALRFINDVPPDNLRRARLIGVHLEGPFLGSAPGAHRANLICDPDLDWLRENLDGVALITMGAEAALSSAAVRIARGQNVVVSIGHSRPSRQQFSDLVDSGATLVTHLFNAMGGLHHRDPGMATWALTDERVHAALIADGVHVAPEMIRLAFACKPEGIVLTTDSVAWRSGRAGSIRLAVVDGAPRLFDGTLAGSVVTMPGALKTCVETAGIPLAKVVRAATSNPAKVMGLLDRGTLQAGYLADVVGLRDDWSIAAVWLSGRQVR